MYCGLDTMDWTSRMGYAPRKPISICWLVPTLAPLMSPCPTLPQTCHIRTPSSALSSLSNSSSHHFFYLFMVVDERLKSRDLERIAYFSRRQTHTHTHREGERASGWRHGKGCKDLIVTIIIIITSSSSSFERNNKWRRGKVADPSADGVAGHPFGVSVLTSSANGKTCQRHIV